jgi:hypothetical protein
MLILMRDLTLAAIGLSAVLLLGQAPARAACNDEATAEARRHFIAAEVQSLKLADCQRKSVEAKQALRKGKS